MTYPIPGYPGEPSVDADRAAVQQHPAAGRVWLWRGGWRPAVIVAGHGPWATVRYRITVTGATGVDTVPWSDLAATVRTDSDQFVG